MVLYVLIALSAAALYLMIVGILYEKASYVSANDAMYIVKIRINDLLEAGIRPDNFIIRLSYNYGKKLFENYTGNIILVKGVRVVLDELLPADYGLLVETRRDR